MQNQVSQDINVVSIFTGREKTKKEADARSNNASDESGVKPTGSFMDVMEKNRQNQERLAKERANANKSVLRSYRIKN